jgi:AcrR family transcriptional regulator
MRDDILEAAIRVLRRYGALRFTTPRVAEAAGISVGSLYQYFPNKQALIFALHSRIVERSWVVVQRILDDPRDDGREKLRRVARMFFAAEAEDVAEMGATLHEAELYFEDQPEYRALETVVLRRFAAFVREALPHVSVRKGTFFAQLIVTVLENVGKAVARQELSRRSVSRWADECATMLADRLGLPHRQ